MSDTTPMQQPSLNVFTLPNLLTVIRLLLVPCFFAGLYYEYAGHTWLDWPIRILLLVIIFSDFLDGYLARRWNTISEFGRLLDPMADKLFVITSFLLLTAFQEVPVWLTIVVVSKDIFVLVGWCVLAILYQRLDVNVSWWGKTATAFQFVTVMWVVLIPELPFLWIWFAITGAVTSFALVIYVYRALQAERSQDD